MRRGVADYRLRDSKYLRANILLGALGTLHLLLADTHVLTHAKLGLRDENAACPGLHPFPYREDVRIGHSRRRHAGRRVNRVIVGPDKFWENVDITVDIFVGEIFIQPIANRPMRAFDNATFLHT